MFTFPRLFARTCPQALRRASSVVAEKTVEGHKGSGPPVARIPRRTTRPKISLARPRKWNRPLAPGVLPAYDEALKLIAEDSTRLKTQAAVLSRAIARAQDAQTDESQLRLMSDKLNVLHIQSQINLPSARWKCANGLANLSNPAHQHLLEQRWRNEGTLDLLMERLHQMHVIPDVLPSLHPSLDLRLTFPVVPPSNAPRRQQIRPWFREVEPGVYLLPQQTRNPPKVFANVFHTDTRLYTLLMVDPDVPDENSDSYQTCLHWLQPNISLSATTPSRIQLENSHTPYMPPHPQRGTPYHRYVTLLLPQAAEISVPVIPEPSRWGFNVREFMREHSLDRNIGGGGHMWREVWNEEVSRIYRDILKMDEPRYGVPPKPDPYAEVKNMKRYAQ